MPGEPKLTVSPYSDSLSLWSNKGFSAIFDQITYPYAYYLYSVTKLLPPANEYKRDVN